MNYNEFKCELQLGREIEFALNGKDYFISHDEIEYNIWSESEKKYIFIGRLEEVLNYKFSGGMSLEENFEKFTIKFIL